MSCRISNSSREHPQEGKIYKLCVSLRESCSLFQINKRKGAGLERGRVGGCSLQIGGEPSGEALILLSSVSLATSAVHLFEANEEH